MLALATPALAARLVDVRVGQHPGFTRIVIETDAPARYRIDRSEADAIQVRIDASARAERVRSSGTLLRSVEIEPRGNAGSVARLELRGRQVDVQELVLAKPPRIVIDLHDVGAAKRTPSATAAKPAPKPAPVAAAEPKPEPAVREPAKPKPAETAATARPTEPAEKAQAAEKTQEYEIAATAEKVAESGAKPRDWYREGASATPPPETREKPVAEAAAGLLEEMRDSAKPAPTAKPTETARNLREVPSGPGSAPSATRPGSSAAPKASPSAKPADEARASGGVLGFLKRPTVLAGIGLLAVLFVGFALARGRGRSRGQEDMSPFAGEDEPFDLGEGETASAESASGEIAIAPPEGAIDAAVAGTAAPMQQDTTEEPPQAPGPLEQGMETEAATIDNDDDAKEGEPVMDQGTETGIDPGMSAGMESGFAPAPPTAANDDVMRMVQELVARVDHLEQKLGEVNEAKERLERQVAAQTEELRVQRSAIARTQRALRSLAKPGAEEPTEPVPKG